MHGTTDEQLLSAYRSALVTVLPSVYRDAFGGHWEMPELLGNVLLESMACGTPAICSDVGGMPEVIEDRVTGFVVPPNDPAAIGRHIAVLAGNPRLWLEMSRCARAHARALYLGAHSAQRALGLPGRLDHDGLTRAASSGSHGSPLRAARPREHRQGGGDPEPASGGVKKNLSMIDAF
jgi:hypothetical protein